MEATMENSLYDPRIFPKTLKKSKEVSEEPPGRESNTGPH
jgi:hypothetical protein